MKTKPSKALQEIRRRNPGVYLPTGAELAAKLQTLVKPKPVHLPHGKTDLEDTIERLTKERDEAQAKLRELAHELLATDYVINGEIHEPNLAQRARSLIHERAQLRAKCAEMREAIKTAGCFRSWDCEAQKEYPFSQSLAYQHALSTDCGKVELP